MRKYEIMYILRANLDEEARKAQMEKLANLLIKNGAKVEKTDEAFGLRDLAYPINDEVPWPRHGNLRKSQAQAETRLIGGAQIKHGTYCWY